MKHKVTSFRSRIYVIAIGIALGYLALFVSSWFTDNGETEQGAPASAIEQTDSN